MSVLVRKVPTLSCDADTEAFVDGLISEQREVDKSRRAMAKEIVEAQPLANIEEARRFAQNWIETAAQHCSNETYWRDRALKAEAALVKENV